MAGANAMGRGVPIAATLYTNGLDLTTCHSGFTPD